jgi:hypothetical protein
MDTNSGTVEYVGDGDGIVDVFIIRDFGATDYFNLTVNDTHATKDVFRLGNGLKLAGSLVLSSGTLDVSDASDYSITLAGNFERTIGIFLPYQGTVTFDGATVSNISGSTTFYNLSSITPSKTLSFAAGSTQTVTNNLTINGQASGTRITLNSGTPGSAWNLNTTGATVSVNYANIQDSNSTVLITPSNSRDLGNNTNWNLFDHFTVGAASGTQTAGASNQLTITAIDQVGSTALSYAGDKSLTFGGATAVGGNNPTVTDKTGSPVDFGSATTITFTNGVSTAGGLMRLYNAGEAPAITATQGSLVTPSPLSVTVNSANFDHFDATGAIGTQAAGTAFTVTLFTADAYGNLTTKDVDGTPFTATESITFTTTATVAPDGVSLPTYNGSDMTGSGVTTDIDLTTGSFTTSDIILYNASETPTLSVSHDGVLATSDPIAINPADASYLAITAGSSTMTAGETNELTITAYDQYGNVATGYEGDMDLYFEGLSDGPNGDIPTVEGEDFEDYVTVYFTAGVSDSDSASLVAYKAETSTVDVYDDNWGIDSEGYGLDLTVDPAAAASMSFTTQPVDFTAGVTMSAVQVSLYDEFGNLCTNDNISSVALSVSSQPAGGDLTFTTPQTVSGGVATFSDITATKAGDYTIEASASGLSDVTSDGFSVDPAAASYLAIAGATITPIAGADDELTVTAYDIYGNVATSYTGTKSLTFSGLNPAPNATNPSVEGTDLGSATNVNFTSGVSDAGSATLIAYKAESQTLDATDGSIDSNSGYGLGLTISPGAANNLNFVQQPTNTVVGNAITPAVTVEVKDQWSNDRTADNATDVSVSLFDNPPGATLTGTLTQTAINGVATFNDLKLNAAGNGLTLFAASFGLTGSLSDTFNTTSNISGSAQNQLTHLQTLGLNIPDSGQLPLFQLNMFHITGPFGPVYFYHPLTPIDISAFDAITLGDDDYEFMNGAINIIGHEGLLPYFGNGLQNR